MNAKQLMSFSAFTGFVVFACLPPATAAPITTTEPATGISSNSAQLNATVGPNGPPAFAFFEWSTNTSYNLWGPQAFIFLSGGYYTSNVSYVIDGLLPNTAFHCRVVAYNTSTPTDYVYGADATFTTGGLAPVITSNYPTNSATTSSGINWTINPENSPTTLYVNYGATTNYGSHATPMAVGGGYDNLTGTITISGLVPGKIYHYQLIALNYFGDSQGNDQTFTTSPAGNMQINSLGGGTITLTWPAGGTLQSSGSSSGPFQSITNAQPPYSLMTTGSQQFFRVQF